MITLKNGKALATVLITALLVGCGASPRENFYTLPIDRTSIHPFDGSSTVARIVVGPITLPEMVDLVRRGPVLVLFATIVFGSMDGLA